MEARAEYHKQRENAVSVSLATEQRIESAAAEVTGTSAAISPVEQAHDLAAYVPDYEE